MLIFNALNKALKKSARCQNKFNAPEEAGIKPVLSTQQPDSADAMAKSGPVARFSAVTIFSVKILYLCAAFFSIEFLAFY